MNEDLKIIKKKYGEKMMHLCRELFPTILEYPGVLSTILLNNFEPTRFLYDDIIDNGLKDKFKDCIYSVFDSKYRKSIIESWRTPEELLSEAGYILYECKTEEELQYFKRYYESNELLCTFYTNRLENCIVFFAVKKDVERIKRENFPNPERQDEYGTSVISIQFTKDESHTLSIKNRYNHTVANPDATFSNNLENIIPGLTESFERFNGLHQRNGANLLEMPGYVRANDGKYYKYNIERNNIYYCPNNIIIDNFEVKRYPKEKYIVMDYFILNLTNGEIGLYDAGVRDSFTDSIANIKNVQVINEKGNKKITFKTHNDEIIIITTDNKNNIIGLVNPTIERISSDFLRYNEKLQMLDLENLIIVAGDFLPYNADLYWVNLPKLEFVGENFLTGNTALEYLSVPKLKKIGWIFLECNERLKILDAPELEEVGSDFLPANKDLYELNAPKLKKVGADLLPSNEELEVLALLSLERCGSLLKANERLKILNVPELIEIFGDCLLNNEVLEEYNMPKIMTIGNFSPRIQLKQEVAKPYII